jgi:Ca2+-binding EF-hand superfamily protein
MPETMVHRVACLLGTSISLGSSVCMLVGLFVSWVMDLDPMFGVSAGGVVGILMSCGIFFGSLSSLNVRDGGLQDPLQAVDDVDVTFSVEKKLGIAFAVRRSTRDGNRWLVITEVAKQGQAGLNAPGITPGMAVKSAQGRALSLGTFEAVLKERPLQVTFGVIQLGRARSPDNIPPPPPPDSAVQGNEGEANGQAPAPRRPPPAPPPGPPPPEIIPMAPPPPPSEPPPLSEEEADKLQQIFNKFDDDADGTLDMRELNHFMVATGAQPFNERKWQMVCKMAGADADEGLKVEHFAKVETDIDVDYQRLFGVDEPEPAEPEILWVPPTLPQQLELIFLKFDADSNGLLDMQESNELMRSTGQQAYTAKQWKKLLKSAGAGLGGLNIEQFRDTESGHLEMDFTMLFGSTPGLTPPGVEMPQGLDTVQQKAWAKKYRH